jgi:DNA-directed RNA polymerase subunit beta'
LHGDQRKYLLPTGAHVMVQNGQEVYPGDSLARIPRATTKTKDNPRRSAARR